MAQRMCVIEGCGREHAARGWCNMHLRRWRKHGDPLYLKRKADMLNWHLRFWSKVERGSADQCWLWTAARTNGYGVFRIGPEPGRLVQAHRLSYELTRGPIPLGRQIDHLCRNRACVNPDHLEAVTQQVNILRGMGATAQHYRRTHCPSGHPYAGTNLGISRQGHRVCLACRRAGAQRRYYARQGSR